MRKVIKNVVKCAACVVSGVLLAVLVLPLVASLVVSVPAVQNAIVHRATRAISAKLGTRVSIDRIALRSINHAVVEGFYVEDFAGDTMLWVPRLVAPVVEWGFGREMLTFGEVELSGAQLWLRQDTMGTMNITRVVDAISGPGPGNPDSHFHMRIMAIATDSLAFGLMLYGKPVVDEGIDWSRFVIRNTRIRVSDFAVDRDTVSMKINSLAFDERSGFRMDRLSARRLAVSRGAVMLDDVTIRSSGADISAPQVYITDGRGSWEGFSDFTRNIPLDIDMARSRVTSALVGWFLPAVAGWNVTLDEVVAHTRGSVSVMAGGIANARVVGTSLALDFTSRGLPDLDAAHFEGSVRVAGASGGAIDDVVGGITGKNLQAGARALLDRMGESSFAGKVSGRMREFDASGIVTSQTGEASGAAKIVVQKGGGVALDGRIATRGMAVGRLAAMAEVGVVAGEATVRAEFSGGTIEGHTKGKIASAEVHGYNYSDLSFDVASRGGIWEGEILARDRALDLNLAGRLDWRSPKNPLYDLKLALRRADLAAMHLNLSDSVSTLACRIEASLAGRTLGEVSGVVDIREASYTSLRGSVATSGATLTARNNASGKYLALRSEFADADFHSRSDYRPLVASLRKFVYSQVPLPHSDATVEHHHSTETLPAAAPGDYSMLKLRTKHTDALWRALSPGMGLAEGSEVSFVFNPAQRSFSLHAHSDWIEWRGMLATELALEADNIADSMVMHLSTADIYTSAMRFPGFAMHGGSKGRQMELSARLAGAEGTISAMVGAVVDGRAGEDVKLRFSPSHITLDRKRWHITSGGATWALGGKTTLDDLAIYSADNPDERLTAAGTISRNTTDTLHVGLRDFDFAPVVSLLRGGAGKIEGRATGDIDVLSMGREVGIEGRVDFAGLAIDGHQAPPLHLESQWDEAAGRIHFGVTEGGSRSRLVQGRVSPRTGALDADARIAGLDAGLVDPLLGGVLEKTTGSADLALHIEGTLSQPRMNGHIEVRDFETTVGYTKARYTLQRGEIGVANSVLTLPSVNVRDNAGGEADFAMRVDMRRLGSIETSIDATTRGLLAFDTAAGGGEAFYGRIVTTGSVGIRSGAAGTHIKVSGRTDRGTRLNLPLNTQTDIARADFVTFIDPSRGKDTTGTLARKRLHYEKRLQRVSPTTTSALDVDITASLTPEAEVRLMLDPNLGRGISAVGEGLLDLRMNPGAGTFTMTGDYTISSGRFDFSMMDIFNKDFVISPGSSLRWSGAPEDARLDVRAAYRLRTSLVPLIGEAKGLTEVRPTVPVECMLQLAGRLAQPEITFDIDLPSADPDARRMAAEAMNTQELKSMQFLSLLATGNFATGNSITGQSAEAGVVATGSVGVDILTSQLSNILSSEDYNIHFRYRPQGERIGNQFDVGLSTDFIDKRLLLKIEGNYVDNRAAESVSSRTTNLAGDVSLTWLIDRAGNLRLKFFSQTIDRLNETQGLQESGLGLYWKRDFDSARDFFSRKKATFTADTPAPRKNRRKAERKKGGGKETELTQKADNK